MDPSALAGLCLLLARGEAVQSLPPGVVCPPGASSVATPPSTVVGSELKAQVASAEARNAIARVTFAEAGNQGDSGLAAVVYTILNRLQDGRWGASVDSVLNARSQFEPVMRAGGDWRRLPPVSAAAQARVDTILNLALEGRLPDLTNGARFFQNPTIVQSRARAGQVSASLVNFGGAAPTVIIGAHSFYADPGRGGRTPVGTDVARSRALARDDLVLFVGDNRASQTDDAIASDPQDAAPLNGVAGDPSQAMFVGRDGRISAAQP
jgi:hypothetical protein